MPSNRLPHHPEVPHQNSNHRALLSRASSLQLERACSESERSRSEWSEQKHLSNGGPAQATSFRNGLPTAPLVVLELVLEIGALREARWRSLAVRDDTGQLDCASDFDMTSLALNIFAPFGASPRTSRTAGRMAHDHLCAALLLPGCMQPPCAVRAVAAALEIRRASSYLALLLDAASSFSTTTARACLSSQHTTRERSQRVPSRVFLFIYVSSWPLRPWQDFSCFMPGAASMGNLIYSGGR